MWNGIDGGKVGQMAVSCSAVVFTIHCKSFSLNFLAQKAALADVDY